MTIQDLFVEAYEDTNTSTANYPYTKALTKFNEIYKKVYRMIVTTQEDYFWTYRNTDLQKWAREYKVEREQTSYTDNWVTKYVPWIAKVKKVLIMDGDGNYNIIPELSDLEESLGMRGWKLKDNHIFLNRTPEEDIEWGLQIQGIQAINDISGTLSSINVEDAIFPWHSDLKDFYEVLVRGLKTELWEHKQDFEKADRCRSYFNDRLEEMKRYITQRVQDIYYSDVQN